jgi:hypothetical protein
VIGKGLFRIKGLNRPEGVFEDQLKLADSGAAASDQTHIKRTSNPHQTHIKRSRNVCVVWV